jgi:hypothetical protein
MINPRFEKFQETNMFIFYGQYAYEEEVSLDRKEEYETLLYNFKVCFKIEFEIEDDYIVTDYIEKYEEPIEDEDIYDFITFCKIILEKIYAIIANFKIEKKQTTKQILKNMEQDQKRIERDIKQREKDELKRKEQDIKRIQRESRDEEARKERESKQLLRIQNEKRKNEEYESKQLLRKQMELEKEQKRIEKENAKQIIKCACGIEYILFNKFNHYKSNDHIIRLEGIRSFIKEYGLNIDIDK